MDSRLLNRNVALRQGRTSMRLEPELWDALSEVCARERVSVANLVERIEQGRVAGGRTSAVRVYLVSYFRAAATDEGHLLAGHGPRA